MIPKSGRKLEPLQVALLAPEARHQYIGRTSSIRLPRPPRQPPSRPTPTSARATTSAAGDKLVKACLSLMLLFDGILFIAIGADIYRQDQAVTYGDMVEVRFRTGGVALLDAQDYYQSLMTSVIVIASSSLIGLLAALDDNRTLLMVVGMLKMIMAMMALVATSGTCWFFYEMAIGLAALHYAAILAKNKRNLAHNSNVLCV